jgi:S1-C subfamily serine protease
MPVSNLVLTVAPVRCFKEGRPKTRASGFFYTHVDKLYFITNRHVIVEEEENYFPDEIELRLHTDFSDTRQNEWFSIRLYDHLGKPLWLEHPVGGKEVDVVAVPLDSEPFKSRFLVKAFSTGSHIPRDVEISIGEDVIVIGYPLGYYDTLHNLPIVRNAIMASVYPVPFEGRPILLIDSRLHSGTSGSPVLTKPAQVISRQEGDAYVLTVPPGQAVTFLVGVHSATIVPLDRDPERDEPLGLNVVWFASLIPEIIEQSGT